jgi:hypothetical protein
MQTLSHRRHHASPDNQIFTQSLELGDQAKPASGGQGEPTPSLPRGKNPEIGNLSIFRILTSNLVSKLFY